MAGEKPHTSKSYWQIVRQQFRKNRAAVWSLRLLIAIAFVALFADFLANEKPLYCKYQDKARFPVLKSYLVDMRISQWPEELQGVQWSDLNYDKVIWPLIPYSPSSLDSDNGQFTGPFEEQDVPSKKWHHKLGTDEIGRDVFSGMIHGTRTALLVGLVAMSIATVIGLFMGAAAGYFGDDRLQVKRGVLFLLPFILLLAGFYWNALGGIGGFALFCAILAIGILLAKGLAKLPWLSKRVVIPVDILVSRFIEIFVSIPGLLLILSIVAVIEHPSLFILMLIIGATRWTGIARLLRGEMLRVRKLEFVEAAQAFGYKEIRTIVSHALPNALNPVLIAIAFGIASAILTEAFLSFLGIGVPPEEVTWGSLLSLARQKPQAWWLAIIPGFAIFITVTIFNLLGEGLTDALDPRLKQ